MKEKFAEFLFKRIKTKIGYVRDSVDEHELNYHLDDLDDYINTAHELVKDIIKETLLP